MRTLRGVPGKPKLSLILLDWGVRESFHSLDYLSAQTADRQDYELIWVEFYDHVPKGLQEKVAEIDARGKPGLDQWLVIDAPRDTHVHKHFAYNVGIALAQGDICVICDSDVIFPENFVEKMIRTMAENPTTVVHVDEVRNYNPRFYPFDYPAVDEILSDPQTTNWNGRMTKGLETLGTDEFTSWANYGACMAARRDDLVAIGGADEHTDYLGYFCGPYDMTFRLVNAGHRELWLDDLFLIHTWHPGEGGDGNVGGPNDGKGSSLRALDLRRNSRISAEVENPAISLLRTNRQCSRESVLDALSSVDLRPWSRDVLKLSPIEVAKPDTKVPRLIRSGFMGYNIVQYDSIYFAVNQIGSSFLPEEADRGAYSRLMQSKNYRDLLPRLVANPSPDYFKPHIIREDPRGYRIIIYKGMYYALPAAARSFQPRNADAGEYDHLVRGKDLNQVLSNLDGAAKSTVNRSWRRSLGRRLQRAFKPLIPTLRM